jgi:hypothetical protein
VVLALSTASPAIGRNIDGQARPLQLMQGDFPIDCVVLRQQQPCPCVVETQSRPRILGSRQQIGLIQWLRHWRSGFRETPGHRTVATTLLPLPTYSRLSKLRAFDHGDSSAIQVKDALRAELDIRLPVKALTLIGNGHEAGNVRLLQHHIDQAA